VKTEPSPTHDRAADRARPGDTVLLVIAPYYKEIADELERGARKALEAAGASVETVTVPGAFEIPAAIAAAAEAGRYAGFVALGCVVRGETSHYDYVCGECARGLMDLSILEGLSIGFGVLTVETLEQARVRAKLNQNDGAGGDKGGEAARAALAMMALRRRFSEGGR
jgi:6,7-dimethyl-8-ribityllumazine synthase